MTNLEQERAKWRYRRIAIFSTLAGVAVLFAGALIGDRSDAYIPLAGIATFVLSFYIGAATFQQTRRNDAESSQ